MKRQKNILITSWYWNLIIVISYRYIHINMLLKSILGKSKRYSFSKNEQYNVSYAIIVSQDMLGSFHRKMLSLPNSNIFCSLFLPEEFGLPLIDLFFEEDEEL